MLGTYPSLRYQEGSIFHRRIVEVGGTLMHCGHHLESLADATAHLKYHFKKHNLDSYRIYHFTQNWGSTALGFGGLGGQAGTRAYTTVLNKGNFAAVYFQGRFAYEVKVNDHFIDDLNKHYSASNQECKRRYEVISCSQ